MLIFPGCKINIGLDVVARRADGYHDLQTLMWSVPGLSDAVELVPAAQSGLTLCGTPVDCPVEQNLCMKALRLMQQRHGAGHAHVYLQKAVPAGAGLGGGSADAAAVVLAANALFDLGLTVVQMEDAAAALGSDVPFFITARPAIATGRGEVLRAVNNDLSDRLAGKHLLIVKPSDIVVSTAEAYAGIRPFRPAEPLERRLSGNVATWRDTVENAFEGSVFALHPRLGQLKEVLYAAGAVYASMSGSGSALYGIFESAPAVDLLPSYLFVFQCVIAGSESLSRRNALFSSK